MSGGPRAVEVRFWEKVSPEPNTGCWFWMGALKGGDEWRYGNFWDGSRYNRAHRVAFELTHGGVPNGLMVCHRCDVPECVNPAHLFLGTGSENQRDKSLKGRGRNQAGAWRTLTAAEQEEVGRLREKRFTIAEIAERFGVSWAEAARAARRVAPSIRRALGRLP